MTSLAAASIQHQASGLSGDRQEGRNGLNGPTIHRHRLGLELRRLREAAGLRLEDASAELGIAASTLSRIETGQAPARTSYVRMLLDRYGLTLDAELQQLIDLAREGQRKGWWADYKHLLPAGAGTYLGLEAAASVNRAFAAQVVPGLLQTSDYAAAVCRSAKPDLSENAIRSLAAAATRRRDFLLQPHHLHAIIDESALLRSVGTSSIMAAQMTHLSEMAADPSCTVQILALSGPRGVLTAPFTVLSFPDPADPDIACRAGSEGQVALIRRHTVISALRDSFDALSSAAMTAEESARLISEMTKPR